MSQSRPAALVLAATAVVAVLAASGCGGGKSSNNEASSSTAASHRPISKADYIAAVDAICFRVNTKRTATKISRLNEVARLLAPLLAYERVALAELRKLTPPPSMSNGWKQIVASSQALSEVNATITQYAREDPNKLERTTALANKAARARQQIIAIGKSEGLKDCAQNS